MAMPQPEVAKRPRDDDTERIIQEALQDEQRRKQQKKGGAAAALPGTGPGVCVGGAGGVGERRGAQGVAQRAWACRNGLQ